MSNIKFPMKPAIHRVERIQPQSPGVWMIPTLSQTATSLFKNLEDTDIGEVFNQSGEAAITETFMIRSDKPALPRI